MRAGFLEREDNGEERSQGQQVDVKALHKQPRRGSHVNERQVLFLLGVTLVLKQSLLVLIPPE